MQAPRHLHEDARLTALDAYAILDTPAESDFDRIVGLAKKICEVPIALISFVAAERQWFKAKAGVEIDETPIDQAICAHAVASGGFLEIPDTLTDDRTRDNPMCTEQGVRFYAGALLTTEEGLPIGTVCVLDTVPRRLTALQREALEVLAEQVVKQLDLKQALRREELLRREIDHRVKNSLMSISSLVRLQSERIADAPVKAILGDVERRIELVAMLHAELHRTSVTEKVAVRPFIRNVEGYLIQSAPAHVDVSIVADPLILPSNEASAIAYIANEFVANSLKYAFPDDRAGTIEITLRELSDSICLVCRDNGIGFPGFDPKGKDLGLGIRIVKSCARQLRGKLEWMPFERGFGLRLCWPKTGPNQQGRQ